MGAQSFDIVSWNSPIDKMGDSMIGFILFTKYLSKIDFSNPPLLVFNGTRNLDPF